MSESGFSGLPPGARSGERPLPQSVPALRGKIIEIRGEIKAQRVRTKIEGEIIRNNPDGTTAIRTEEGELTVQLRGRDRPKEGAKVEIEIPAGDPPKQVILRAPPQQPQPVQQTSRSRPQDLPLPPSQELPLPPPKTEIITPETILRLTPLPPEQSEQIIQPALRILQTKLTTPPTQTQSLTENNIPPVLLEQATPLISVPFEKPEQTIQEQIFTSLRTGNFGETIQFSNHYGLLRHDLPRNDSPQGTQFTPILIIAPPEEQKEGKKEGQQKGHSLPSLTLLPPALQTENISIAQSHAPLQIQTNPKLRFFDIHVQTITPPQVTFSPIQTQTSSKPKPRISAFQPLPRSKIQTGMASSITGTITGITPQNLPVIAFFTPELNTIQNFVMPFQAENIPPGTEIEIVPQRGITDSFQAIAPATAFTPIAFFSNSQWPAMEEILQTLQQSAPQAAQVFARNTANAHTPARLPMLALFFIAAVRSGDISSWLGDKTVDALRRLGKGDLLSRLNRDISGLQKTSADSLSQDWRGIALPIMGDETLQKMILYYRHDQKNEKNDKENRQGTRFIFDLSLNRIGAIQLDGLHRSGRSHQAPQSNQSAPGHLDLIVRTHHALSQPMKQNMRHTYINALEQTDLTGTLSFQNDPAQFIKIDMPQEDIIVSA